jgi:transketolase
MPDNKIPCRKAFTTALLEEARKDNNIFVVTSDARGSVTLDDFANELPRQFVEVGIAEQNAVGMAAGLASCGKNVFVCGPACFYSARSLEQVKVDVAYSRNNVKIIGVSGGVSYGALGFSHHSLHDIAVMRTIPGLNIYFPADRYQTEQITRHLAKSDEPAYVRMGRNAVPDVYSDSQASFTPGKANILREGTDITIIAAGETVFHALKAADLLKQENISAFVMDMPTIKPIDREAILMAAKTTGCIITVEEHSIYGGLGAAVAEIVSQECPVKMKIMGFPDEELIHANPSELFEYYGLTGKGIYSEAKILMTSRIFN